MLVWLANVYDEDSEEGRLALFSSTETAMAWMKNTYPVEDYGDCLTVTMRPMIIDMPDYEGSVH